MKTEEEHTDYETDNDQPSQVESNDVNIKKENYGSYDDETDNEELPEKVKSNLDVKIEEEDTDNEWVEGYATSYQAVSWYTKAQYSCDWQTLLFWSNTSKEEEDYLLM